MKKALRVAKYVVMATVVVTVALFLHYNLPRTDVVQIVGTDVKRNDIRVNGEVVTRDIRFITSLTQNGKTRVYRNEDTGWGWPPYFKFDSADLTAKAQSFVGETEKSWALVTHYGWRVTMLSSFPNAVAIKKVDQDYSHLPLFNIIFLLSLFGGILFLVLAVRRFLSRRRTSAD